MATNAAANGMPDHLLNEFLKMADQERTHSQGAVAAHGSKKPWTGFPPEVKRQEDRGWDNNTQSESSWQSSAGASHPQSNSTDHLGRALRSNWDSTPSSRRPGASKGSSDHHRTESPASSSWLPTNEWRGAAPTATSSSRGSRTDARPVGGRRDNGDRSPLRRPRDSEGYHYRSQSSEQIWSPYVERSRSRVNPGASSYRHDPVRRDHMDQWEMDARGTRDTSDRSSSRHYQPPPSSRGR